MHFNIVERNRQIFKGIRRGVHDESFQREHPVRKMVIHFGQAERCLRQKSWKVAFEPKNPES